MNEFNASKALEEIFEISYKEDKGNGMFDKMEGNFINFHLELINKGREDDVYYVIHKLTDKQSNDYCYVKIYTDYDSYNDDGNWGDYQFEIVEPVEVKIIQYKKVEDE